MGVPIVPIAVLHFPVLKYAILGVVVLTILRKAEARAGCWEGGPTQFPQDDRT